MRLFSLFTVFLLVLPTFAQERKLQNKPFIDERRLHYGFFIGAHDQGLSLTNNGYIDAATGRQWLVANDRPNYGFHVGVLAELKLNKTLALRVLPSLYFGSKHLRFQDQTTGETETQEMKSTYIGLPVQLKVTAPRFNNYRPYVIAGISPLYDLTANKHTLLRTKPVNVFLDLGLGCDFYLPFFKLIPELKFSFGLANILDKTRRDLTDSSQMIYTESVDRATANMVTFTLYFE